MQKQIILYLLCLSFFSTELIAQNLNLKVTGANDKETIIINNYNYKKNHIDYSSISSEVDSLHKNIIKTGYIESSIISSKKTNDSSFVFNLQLNNKYETINIYYDNKKVNKQIIDIVSNESFDDFFNIPFTETERVLSFINSKIANQGFPFSKIRLSEIKPKDNKTLTANLIIIEGESKRGLDKIILKGYDKFPKSYLKHYLKIKPSETFSIETIKKKINTLDNLRFANQIKAPEILFTKDSTQLYLYIEKSNSNTFDGFLGFSTDEETNKLDFNGYLDLNLINNFNYGESLKLLYKSNETEQKNFEAKLNLPYILGTPIGTELELNILKQDSSFSTTNQKAKLFYLLNSKNTFFLGIESIESNNLLNNININSLDDYKSNFYTIRYDYENRKNYNTLFQLNTLISIEAGFGSRNLNNIKEEQTKLTLNAHHILYLNDRNSIFIRTYGAFLISENHLKNELFRFGGINSIRGFQESSLLATKLIALNTEYRYKLSNNIYAHTIIDFANLNNEIDEIKENLYGFGLGFGILTKAGLLRFNYANGKTESQQFKFSNSKIHLSLTAIF
ncbi:hypothetical protein [uncultured Lacinutrix sp.]|uniref:hypothetical protein n=1 Tax=uncultured Lacinutrix sp. TaxID=574032 RepID=UPI002635BCD1|nr:hypothetical protein [uncultured Lacinutrix sp.]